jgi:hypothetical protein
MALPTINNFWILRMPKALGAQWQASTVSQIEAASAHGLGAAFNSPIAKPRDYSHRRLIGVAEWQMGRAILRTE